jgi:glycosyltransferase involved in cell wall biosynthesis
MKNIVYLVSTLKRTGPTAQLYNIIKNLDKKNYRAHVITLSPEPSESRWQSYSELGIKVYSLSLSRMAGLLLSHRRLLRLLNEIRPDIIHTQGIRADILASSLSMSLPKLCTIRNIPQDDYGMTYGQIKGHLMVWQHVKAMRRMTRCVGVSDAVTENLMDCFKLPNTVSIKNGVDTDIYYPVSNSNKANMRKKLELPATGKIWLVSGHLSSRKDPLFLLKAWKSQFGGDQSNHLVFVGDGPLMQECLLECKGVINIHLVGRVADVASYLQASDYFVSSSKAEGLPNAVLEALACGLPVLLSDIHPHLEIWEMSRGIGKVYALNDENSFTRAILDIEKKDYDAMSRAACGLINNHLSAALMSSSYQRLYSELLGEFS